MEISLIMLLPRNVVSKLNRALNLVCFFSYFQFEIKMFDKFSRNFPLPRVLLIQQLCFEDTKKHNMEDIDIPLLVLVSRLV